MNEDYVHAFGIMVKTMQFYKIAPVTVRRWWREYTSSVTISKSPDRDILRLLIFPNIIDLLSSKSHPKMLWIGCARYTRLYYSVLESRGGVCWTLDIDPHAKRWGRKGHHIVGDLRSLATLLPEQYFDAVLCNGVFGYGIDTREAQISACQAMAQAMLPGNWMILGWNTDKVADPLENGVVTPWFAPAKLPRLGARQFVKGCTHVYDFLKRQ